MIQCESKLFYGMELGSLVDILALFKCIVEKPPHQPVDNIDYIGWINTQIPDGVYLEVTYPYRDCDEKDMVAHLTLIDEDEISKRGMKKIIKNSNLIGYGYILGQLDIDFQDPIFYTRHYVYFTDGFDDFQADVEDFIERLKKNK